MQSTLWPLIDVSLCFSVIDVPLTGPLSGSIWSKNRGMKSFKKFTWVPSCCSTGFMTFSSMLRSVKRQKMLRRWRRRVSKIRGKKSLKFPSQFRSWPSAKNPSGGKKRVDADTNETTTDRTTPNHVKRNPIRIKSHWEGCSSSCTAMSYRIRWNFEGFRILQNATWSGRPNRFRKFFPWPKTLRTVGSSSKALYR
jgi:hypothetical protein